MKNRLFHSRLAPATALLVSVVMLGACAPNLGSMPAMHGLSDYFTHQSFTAPTIDWPHDQWWQAYNDPQLNQLMTTALAASPDMALATARLQAAQAQAQQAGAGRFPSLSLNGETALARQSYNNGVPAAFVPQGWNDTGQITANLSYEIDLWGKTRATLAAATSQAEAAQADAANARLMLTTSLASAYAQFALQAAQYQQAVSASTVRASTAGLLGRRYHNGLENIGSFKQAQALQASAAAEVAQLQESLTLTRHRIAALAGQGPDYGLALTTPTAILAGTYGAPANLEANLLGRRPDVIASRLTAESAAARIKVAHAAYYPNLNLNAFIGRQAFGVNLLDNAGSTFGSVGPAISLPLFTGGQVEGSYRQARANYDASVATYNQSVVTAMQQVADALTSEQSLATRITLAAQEVSASTQAYTVMNNRYRGGLATYLDVLTAEDHLIDSRRNATTLQAQGLTLNIALIKALGGGYGNTSPTLSISNTTVTKE